MIRLLLGGSPCTAFSIAQKNNRETQPNSGIGWELFKNYLIAKEKFKPDYFLYENNKSAAQPIKDEIKKQLGVWDGTFLIPYSDVRYIEINSALVSAQNRERFYVHNCGEVGQPKDRGILLKDVLISGCDLTDNEKSYALTASYNGAIPSNTIERKQRNMIIEPINPLKSGKAHCVTAGYSHHGESEILQANYSDNPNQQKWDCVAEPVRVGAMPRPNGELSTSAGMRIYSTEGKGKVLIANGGGQGAKTGLYAVPVRKVNRLGGLYDQHTRWGIFDKEGKSPTLTASMGMGGGFVPMVADKLYYNYATEFDGDGKPTKAYCYADGKIHTVYEVKDGKITIKGKEYPIKLPDGFYIIRKLTVTECCRMQGMPEWWFRDNDGNKLVSDTQAYKGLGNGWQLDTVKYILEHALRNIPKDEPILLLSLYDGIGTGRRILEELGFTNVKYVAYEIDKHCIMLTKYRYPDVIHKGDAFQVRNDDWEI